MAFDSKQIWSFVQPRLRAYLGTTWEVEKVATMTHSTELTVAGWLIGQEPPGERLIKLWHLLAAFGSESPELRQLPDFNRYCGELLTFGIVTLDEVTTIAGLQNPQGGLKMLRGSPPMHPMYSRADLESQYGPQLQRAKARFKPVKTSQSSQTVHQKESPAKVAALPRSAVPESSGAMLFAAASVFQAALSFARYLDSGACTPEQRSALRELMGESGMFDLSNHFNNLCSERARSGR